MFENNCPNCGELRLFKSKRTYRLSIINSTVCYTCSNGKRKVPNRHCVDCNASITKNRKVFRCKKCASKEVNNRPGRIPISNWNHKGKIKSVETRKRLSQALVKYHESRRATLLNLYEEKRVYYNAVRRITAKQPLHLLENWNKIGRGVGPEIFHVDHIISKIEGFCKKISPEIIGDISNLRIICSIRNNKKGTKEQKIFGIRNKTIEKL